MNKQLSLLFALPLVLVLAAQARGQITQGSGGSSGGGGPPTGAAGGDLGGTYPNPTVTSVAHVATGVLPAVNGGSGISSYGSAGFLQGCLNSTTGNGKPGTAAEMWLTTIYQPVSWQFTNSQMAYSTQAGDGSAENDVCLYSVSGTTATLIADSGLIALSATANPAAPVNLGGGSSNLATQPTATTCGSSGSAACVGGIWAPGFYATAMASNGTTGAMRSCVNQWAYFSSKTISAPSGECPTTATVTAATPTGAGAQAPILVQPW